MNFFEQQHQARKNTKFLIVLFALAVTGIVLAVSALITVVLLYMNADSHTVQELNQGFSYWSTVSWTAPLVVAVILMVSWMRMLQLGGSGDKVAQFLGGTELGLGEKDDLKDQQLRNVVEEMSIASGVPVPGIYVMRGEEGINAFAAGTEPSKAVIGVTQGTLDTLSREELQGVVAHEYSHIFNGDMRLNMRLIGVLAGIMFLTTAGRVILEGFGRGSRRSSKNDGAGAILVLGLGLIVIGAIGAFFARWIKAAVSRQREFLADASAVQFTRNPAGLSGALQAIQARSSSVHAGAAEEASHFFFGSIKHFALFATHPPLEERLARIGRIHIDDTQKPNLKSPKEAVARVGKPRGEDFVRAVTIIQGIGQGARAELTKPRSAVEMVLAVLAKDSNNAKVLAKLNAEAVKTVNGVAPEHYLALIDLAMPALRHLEPTYAANFLMTVETMIQEDSKIQPLEIAVLAILRRQLGGKARASSSSLTSLKANALDVLKIMASCGTEDQAKARAAFQEGAAKAGADAALIEKHWAVKIEDPLSIVKALTRLSTLPPREKAVFFEALWLTANHDKTLTLHESQYLRAFSEALEIPLPASLS